MTGNYAIYTRTLVAAAALEANRFITLAGGYPSAGGAAFGVTRTSAGQGDLVAADVLGTTHVEASAAINADAVISVTANGRAATSTPGDIPAGRALEAAANEGDIIEVMLVPSTGVKTPV